MLLRALVVLLLILNLGVVTWWATRGAPDGPPPVVLPADVPRLQLAGEIGGERATPSVQREVAAADERAEEDLPAPAETVAVEKLPADPPECHAIGPFADVAGRDAAQARLAPIVVRIAPREVVETPRGWRVWMPPLADRAAANAMVARLVEAGFNDYYVIADGEEANGIALGRFGSEAGATSRADALRTAGFDVAATPLGSALVRYWIDIMAAGDSSGETLRALVAAARVEPRDCNAPGDAG